MTRQSFRLNRRAFVAGAIGAGTAGVGVRSATGRTWAEYPETPDDAGRLDVIVRFESASDAGKASLQRHARTTKRPFERFAAERAGVSIERRFWAVNAALVSVDVERVSRQAILAVDSVTDVHPNFAVGVHGTADGRHSATDRTEPSVTELTSQTEQTNVTYPLSQMDVPQAWQVHDTRGEGVDVAVLDTGIDTTGHEELAASLDRGGWAEFDERGDRIDSEPNAQTDYPAAGHGTGVSGVIAGGVTDDGTSYGVAPGVNLHMAQMVSQPPEGIRVLSVFAAIEWAIQQDVDIVSMSLGLPQYNRAFVEPIRNAIESGLLVVAAIGNAGHDTASSPANVPGVLSAGATDEDRAIYKNSGGERVDTDRYWGETAPDQWPDQYTVPDVTAPGVDVLSPVLDGEYGRNSGTSFAAPHVAGVAALVMAATDADADAVRDAITETARHPAATDEFDVDPGHDDRYGRGIVSALAAISRLTATETLSGTVTDGSGNPLAGVTVASEAGPRTETDPNGRYELALPPGSQPVGATGLGFETTGASLDPADTNTRDFQLTPSAELGVAVADRMAERIDPGGTATATFDVANAERVVVEPTVNGLLEPGELQLTVDGDEAAFGEPVEIDPDRTRVEIGVGVPPATLVGQFRLSYEFTGGNSSVTGESHRVYAHRDPLVISAADPPTLQVPVDLVAPRTTIELSGGEGAAVAEAGDSAGIVIDKPLTLTAADGATPTVQFSADGAERPAAVLVTANDVTVSGLTVEGAGATTGVRVGRTAALQRGLPQPAGVTIRNCTVSGADTAVHAGQAPALRIEGNELTATTTAVSVGRQVPFRDSTTVTSRATTTITGNSITDVETGIDVAGQVAAIGDNEISNVSGTAIQLGTPRFLSLHWGASIGPIRSNTITEANRGIVVSGVLTLPIEENSLSAITETALVVEGAVLAAIRSNSVQNAGTGLSVAEDGEVGELIDNEFTDIREPGDEADLTSTPTETDVHTTTAGTDLPTTTAGAGTDEATPTASPRPDTESDDSGVFGPGFGVGAALAGLGLAGYRLRGRLSGDGADAE